MKPGKRARLEAKGWKVGSTAEFLKLSPEESAYLDLKLALSQSLQKHRRRKGMTQHQLARLLKSSQSRVAKMEASDASVSLDLLVRSLLALGSSKSSVLRILPR